MNRAKLRLKLDYRDYFKQALTFSWPAGLKSTSADASVIVTQPYGFEQKLPSKAKRVGDRGEVVINYPLVDEGRFAPTCRLEPHQTHPRARLRACPGSSPTPGHPTAVRLARPTGRPPVR